MRTRHWIAWCLLTAAAYGQRLADFATPQGIPRGSTLVVGFLGGFEKWDDPHRGVRKLVLRLREEPGIYADSASNHRRKRALRMILRALDTDGNGKLDDVERGSARVILFGQSWGGGATVLTARDLNRRGIPVLLTVQVDSVGVRDKTIPPNVAEAVNFYQHDPLTIQGRREIVAEDPNRTAILGNFQAVYVFRPVDSDDPSWARRTLGGSHAKMELDPETWTRVEQFIKDAISKR